VLNHELEHCIDQRCECSKLSLVIIDSISNILQQKDKEKKSKRGSPDES